MEAIEQGSRGWRVWALRHLLTGDAAAGWWTEGGAPMYFDAALSAEVRELQQARGLLVDEIVGPETWDAVVEYGAARGRDALVFGREPSRRMKVGGGAFLDALAAKKLTYKTVTLRADVAAAYEPVVDRVVAAGGTVTSAGGVRPLSSAAGPNRSALSFHYAGLALDLGLYTGMVTPGADPFIVVRDPVLSRRFRVYARVETGGRVMRLPALADKGASVVEVEARVMDFTALMADAGFVGIRARRSAWPDPARNYGGAEWWHFQYQNGLAVGDSTFGDALLALYGLDDLRDSAPWRHRHAVYGAGWN